MSNRPINSLSELLHYAMPQSQTSVQDRLAILDGILAPNVEPEIGWRVALGWARSLNGGGIMTPARRPVILDWRLPPEHEAVSTAERKAQVEGIVDRLVAHVLTDCSRWADLIDAARHFGGYERRALIAVASIDPRIDEEQKIWTALRKRIYSIYFGHRAETHSSQLAQLEALYASFEPLSVASRSAWLFEYSPKLPEPVAGERNDDKLEEIAIQRRRESLVEIWEGEERWSLLAELVRLTSNNNLLGVTLAQMPFAEILEGRFFAGESSEAFMPVTPGFSAWRSHEKGLSWLETLLGDLVAKDRWLEAARIAQHCPQTAELWDILDRVGEPLHV